MKLFKRFLAHFHRHKWKPAKTNKWFIVFERKCSKCGAIEHSKWNDFKWDTVTRTWHPGPHPD